VSDFAGFCALSALLRGAHPGKLDWMDVLRVANHALVTPALAAALDRDAGAVEPPGDVRVFLNEVAARTAERNRRLLAQLSEAVGALNAAGIEPLLLKGAAFLVGPGDQSRSRILSDLDLLVSPDETEAAIQALQGAGFRVLARYPEYESHVAAELGRDSDVGGVDLHRRRPGPRHILSDPALERPSKRVDLCGGIARRGSPESRILEIALHDLFHEGDYWRGALDLRHLIDISVLCSSEDIDWSLMSEPALGVIGRRGVRRHLIAANELLGAPAPCALLDSPGARLEHWRSMWQMRAPVLRGPLLLAALLGQAPGVIEHFRKERLWQASFSDAKVSAATRATGRLNRLREFLGPAPIGKI
jgi:hypothetical protein